MVTAVTVFRASDGTTFNNEADANAYEAMLAYEQQINEFVNQHFPSKGKYGRKNPAHAIAKKAIALWLGQHGQTQSSTSTCQSSTSTCAC